MKQIEKKMFYKAVLAVTLFLNLTVMFPIRDSIATEKNPPTDLRQAQYISFKQLPPLNPKARLVNGYQVTVTIKQKKLDERTFNSMESKDKGEKYERYTLPD